MKSITRVLTLLTAFASPTSLCTASESVPPSTDELVASTSQKGKTPKDSKLKLLEDKVYDFVLVTDDCNFRAGMEEDETLEASLQVLNRTVTRISLQDPDFDWNSTKSIVIRSAWEKVSRCVVLW